MDNRHQCLSDGRTDGQDYDSKYALSSTTRKNSETHIS